MNFKKIAILAVLVLVAVISFTKVAPMASESEINKHSIEQTDEKIKSVMTLSGGAAATSATLSLLPGDMCTPLAEQLADLAKYFVLILSALYLEKFLVGISGYIFFRWMVPAACILAGIYLFSGKSNFLRTAGKILLIGAVIFTIVPASVKISDMVYQTQEAKVNDTIDEYNDLEIEGDSDSGFLNEFTTITTETVDNITAFIDDMLESLAVMIVTSCLIPVLVFVCLVWFVKTIFSANILVLDTSTIDNIASKLAN